MNILQYELNENFDLNDVEAIVNYIRNNGIEIIAIPKDFDLLLDCNSYYLNFLKEKIEDAIRKKEIIYNV
jgi:hypothetical protein